MSDGWRVLKCLFAVVSTCIVYKHKFVTVTFHSLCTRFTDDDMLQESGIYTGQLMILEVKKNDGTWPRDTSKSWP